MVFQNFLLGLEFPTRGCCGWRVRVEQKESDVKLPTMGGFLLPGGYNTDRGNVKCE